MTLALVSPSDDVVLVFLCQVLVLLVAAKLLGWALSRIGQPSVVGELLAGLLLGPSLLGRIAPDGAEWLFPDDPTQGAMLSGLAWIGLLLLLASTGFESDLAVIRKLGRPVIWVTLGSLLVPLAGGVTIGALTPETFFGEAATRTEFSAFLAVALSISSLPVLAKVLAEMGLVRRNIGQMILAVAIANDVVGWVLLGVVAGLVGSSNVDAAGLAVTVVGVAAFLIAALTIGQRAVDRLLWTVATAEPSTTPAVAILALVVGAGALTQWMGVEAVLGAFIAGLVVARSQWRDERALRLIESLAHGILAPLFFATAGLRVDVDVFSSTTVATWAVIIIAGAGLTKFLGAVIGARLGHLPAREGVALGAALNARGALEIVVASIGLSLGVLNDASYGVIVVMAIVTSLAAPPMLRSILRDWPGTEEEQQRLRAEEAARDRLVLSDRPALLPSRGNPPSIAAAQLIDMCWPQHAPVTVFAEPNDADLATVKAVLNTRPIRIVRPRGDHIAATITTEAGKGHSAIVLGVTDRPEGPVLSPFLEAVLRSAHRPVILIRGERTSGHRLPEAFARAVVPVTGSINSRAAQEVAFKMSEVLGTELSLIHLDPTPGLYQSDVLVRMTDVAEPLLTHARQAAIASGARPTITIARTADSIPGELARIVLELDADVVVVGTTPRTSGDRVRLGPVAAHLLETSPATVIVVATPPGWTGQHSRD